MKSQHRRATLANLVCSLIAHNRLRTTIARAKVLRRYADRMITLAKKGELHHRRRALAFLRHKPAVTKLFAELGKQHAGRNGGYTRIVRVGPRPGDAAEMAIVEWTGTAAPVVPEPDKGKKGKKKEAAPAAGEPAKAEKTEKPEPEKAG